MGSFRELSTLREFIGGEYDTLSTGSQSVAVEIKRRAGIDAVEQLTRYLTYLNEDPSLRPVRGMLAAQEFTKQAVTLATDRGIECKTVNYDELRGLDDPSLRLF